MNGIAEMKRDYGHVTASSGVRPPRPAERGPNKVMALGGIAFSTTLRK
ncbi:hypothetical protein AB0L00_31925 [Actinoallomurus sp. NPDC052308]